MIDSELSGIAFTVDPVDKSYSKISIEASYGLGEAIVSGKVTPDVYTVDKNSTRLVDKVIANKTSSLVISNSGMGNEWVTVSEPMASSQVLSDSQILDLSQIVLNIEKHYTAPQDVEWAFVNGQFYIMQSRPITTLAASSKNHLSNLHRDDFSKIYASKGLPFLYEDMISEYYIRWQNIIICINGGDHVFANNDSLHSLRKKGIDVLPSDLKKIASNLDALLSDAICAGNAYILDSISKDEVINEFSLLTSILSNYGYFDHCYWDDAYFEKDKNNSVKEVIALVQDLKNRIRSKLDTVFFSQTGLFSSLLQSLGKRFVIPIDQLYWYKRIEVEAIFDGFRLGQTSLNNRQQCALFYRDEIGLIERYEGVDALNTATYFLDGDHTIVLELQGKPAHSKGIVRGTVRKIVRDYTDSGVARTSIAGMHSGEILLSETTDPELLDAIGKASAIVTEIGGMLSHAAISARELDIPCVVGVSGVMAHLSDGDHIEVNSTNGKIRILKIKDT